MVQVMFHTGVEDRVLYACRLLRKAARQRSRVLVRTDVAEADLLDKALWTFDAQDFVPHVRLREAQTLPGRLAATPIWIAEGARSWPQDLPRPQVLVQWGAPAAGDVELWERIIEVVTLDEDDKRAARQRWRDYESRGWTPKAVTVGGQNA